MDRFNHNRVDSEFISKLESSKEDRKIERNKFEKEI